jgi:hypothetical protein
MLIAAVILCACGRPAESESTAPQRPDFQLATDAAYDFSVIEPYSGNHQAVYDYIEAHQYDHLAAIRRWLRQPSISAQNDGVLEMAEMLRGDLESMGFEEAELVPGRLPHV